MGHETAENIFLPKRYSQNFSENFDDTIAILVGPAGREQHFTIHKDLICANSKFFKAACSKLWAEGREKLVRLPEVEADTFQAYVVWVYSQKVVINESTKTSVKSGARDDYGKLVELYLLGDVLDDLLLRNSAMRTLIAKNSVWKVHPRSSMLVRIWKSTTPGSRLRQMIVDKTIMRFSRDDIETVGADWPQELLHAIVVGLAKQVPTVSDTQFVSGLDNYLEPEASDDSEMVT